MLKLQCVGCKNKRDMTPDEAAAQDCQPCCSKCGMPEIVISAHVSSRPSIEDLRKALARRKSN